MIAKSARGSQIQHAEEATGGMLDRDDDQYIMARELRDARGMYWDLKHT